MSGTHGPRRGGVALIAGIGLACLASSLLAPGTASGEGEGKIRHYNILGRTGLSVSDIGFGAGATTDPSLIEYALEMGINYFDTAESYGRGRSETAIGQVAAKHREKMVICTKMEMNGNTTQADIFSRLDASLGRLQTDHVEILMIHGGNQDALENPDVYAAFDKLKEQGKIRFSGVSHHGPNIAVSLTPVIEAGKLDVILCSYDPVGDPGIPAMLEAARQKGIGLVAMKVFPSARAAELPEFSSGEQPFHLAALRWALKTSRMHCVIPSMNMMDQIDEYAQVSGAARE